MNLFNVNMGCRDQDVGRLRGKSETAVRELGTSMIIVPDTRVKNGEDRLIARN